MRAARRFESYSDEAAPPPAIAKPNHLQVVQPGDYVRMRQGLQRFKVRSVNFCRANGRYIVHAKAGPCSLWQWQDDLVL